MINWFRRAFRVWFRRGRHRARRGYKPVLNSAVGTRSHARAAGAVVIIEAQLLREVCGRMLSEGQSGPELAAWCRRVLDEPSYAERAVAAATRARRGRWLPLL